MSCRIISRMLAAAWLASIMAVAASGQTHDADEKKGWLGGYTTSTIAQTAQQFNLKLDSGAVVEYVVAGGPAEKHGIREGDVIVKVDEQDISTPSEFGNALYGRKAGEELLLEIARDGTRQSLQVVMGEQPSDAEFARLHRSAAEKGNPRAQAQLGRAYMFAEDANKDYEQAMEWLQRSANQGNPTGQRLLGLMFDKGYGVEQSYSDALKWYVKAAEQADAASQNNIGILCEHGRGVQQDEATAVGWFRVAAKQGLAGAQCNLASMYEGGRGVKKDYEEALKWYRKAADQGDARGQTNVGWAYEFGQGVERDYQKAVSWYRKAAEQGYAWGQTSLGVMYRNGRGVEQDYAQAMDWYGKAAEQGDNRARNALGEFYDFGTGVERDYEKAIEWYRKAAAQDYAWAQYHLGCKYEFGQGVEEDDKEAVRWYRKAAEQGHKQAQDSLGTMYQNGDGVEKNYAEAMSWYRKAAEQGYANAQNNLGEMYQYGTGVERDYATAIQWYRKAAEQDHAWAQYHLGVMYKRGSGVEEDLTTAFDWFGKAARQEHALSQYEIAKLYENGKGTLRDYAEAANWYRQAAERGNRDAQYDFGRLSELGLGVSANMDEAAVWYRKSAAQGHEQAQKIVNGLRESAALLNRTVFVAEDVPDAGPGMCIIELRLPRSATVTVDGHQHGDARTIVYQDINPNEVYRSDIEVRFKSGEVVRRSVSIQSGHRILLPILPQDAKRPELALQTGHNGAVTDAVFSSDSRLLLTGACDGTANLWEVATGRQLRTYSGHKEWVEGVGFVADETRLVTSSGFWDEKIVIWERDSGRKVRTIPLDSCIALAVGPNGRQLLVGGNQGTATLWDADSGQRLKAFKGSHSELVHHVGISPNGRRILTDSENNTVVLWDVSSGKQLRVFGPHEHNLRGATFSPDGQRILVATDENLVVWDAEKSTQVANRPSKWGYIEAAFSPDGKHVAAAKVLETTPEGTEEKELVLYEADTLEPVWHCRVDCAAMKSVFSPDGVLIFDGIALRRTSTGQEVRSFRRHQKKLHEGVFSPDGRHLLISLYDHAALLDLESGCEVRQYARPDSDLNMYHLVFASAGQRIVARLGHGDSNQAEFVVFETLTGQLRRRFPRKNYATDFSITADGSRMLTCVDKNLTVWNLNSGRPEHQFVNKDSSMASLSPDGRYVLMDPDNRFFPRKDRSMLQHLASLRETSTRRTLQSFSALFQNHAVQVSVVPTFSPDGQTVATTGAVHTPGDESKCNGVIQLWTREDGRLLHTLHHPLRGLGDWIPHFSFSADGRFALSHSFEKTTMVWHVKSGKQVFTTTAHSAMVTSPSLSPDGGRLATISADGSLRLWDVDTGDELVRVLRLKNAAGWLAVTPEGLFDGAREARQKVAFRIGGGLKVVPVDRFFQDFYRPGLLAELWSGKRPMPKVELGQSLPPIVKITSPVSEHADTREVTIEVQATDQGGGVSGLAIYQNNARVLAPGETQKEGNVICRTFRIALVEGENHLRITAASGDGSWEAEPAEIVLTYEEPLGKSELHVLAVGASRYADANLNLNFAARDAQVVAELFRRRGGDLYANVHITEVVDKQATRKGITQALKKVTAATSPQDTLVVFLAGHRTMVGQRYYFVPHEMRRQEDLFEDDIRKQGLPADEISDYLGSAKALKRLLILDTCASGGALGPALKSRSGFALRGAIERLSRTQGIFTIAAAAATEEAQESKDLGHGVLSYALLAGLKAVEGGPLDGMYIHPNNPERVVDVMDWFSFAAGHVPRLTEGIYGISQDVQMSTQGTSFPVLPLDE